MNQTALPYKPFSLTLILLIFNFLIPGATKAQSKQVYHIKGVVVNGLPMEAIQITLADSNTKAITSIMSDSLGQFTFKGLPSGKYHLMNKVYKLDTIVTISDHSIEPFVVELNVCEVDAIQASADIQQGKIRLLLAGSIAPVYYKGQEAFELKYKVKYYDYGCTVPEHGCMVAYNQAIFKYLDKQYGKLWRRDVRKDVVGYKQLNL